MPFLAQIRQWESRRFRAIAAFCQSMAAMGTQVAGRLLALLKTSMSIVIVTETSSAPRGYRLRIATVMLLLASPIALAFGSAALLASRGSMETYSRRQRQANEGTYRP
jgi:ABC-type uncharacterized transport system YnjBCD permease subunit